MAFESDRRVFARTADRAVIFDEGLRAHMLRVYNYMTGGLALTGLVAWFVGTTPAIYDVIFGTPLMWVAIFAPFAMILVMRFRVEKMSAATLQTLYWIYAGLMGLSLATVFVAFTGASIARVFFITSGSFAALSLYGYTTKKDLSGWGSFLFIGLVGIIIASVVNIFLASSALQFAVSVAGVLIFAGLTAYDTQQIKVMYSDHHDTETSGKLAVFGALRLYLDFVNMFLLLLQLFGNRN